MKEKFILEKIQERKQKLQYRSLRTIESVEGVEVVYDGKRFINFSSNNYLGLANHPALKKSGIDFIEKYGTGALASRLLSGTHSYHDLIELHLAKLIGTETALLLNSGFQANLTLLSALGDSKSLILIDKACHNSLIQGALLSRAQIMRYRHNDLNHLTQLLEKSKSRQYTQKIIVTETIFSMDGDVSDIDLLISLADCHQAFLFLDESHAFGVAGINGMGLAAHKKGVDLIVGGLGKGAGSFGAYVGCSARMREYLINFCTGIIYSTAMPPSVAGSIYGALLLLPDLIKEREILCQNSQYLRKNLKDLNIETGSSTTHIIPLILKEESQVLSLAKIFEENNILTSAIRPPTVPYNGSRVRLSLSCMHKKEHLDHLLNILKRWQYEFRS